MEQTDEQQTYMANNRLFHFTKAEEAAMKRAIYKAKKFMEEFGKGQVERPYFVNLKHYNNYEYEQTKTDKPT